MDKKVILLKTHCWSEDLENFVLKILSQTKIDFYIILHDNDGSIIQLINNDSVKKIILLVTELDIRKTYQKGFFSMWLSNHWLLMWFYQKFPTYDYYWSIEYDVRISGDSNSIWNYEGVEDFVFVSGNFYSKRNIYNNYYLGDKLGDEERYSGYLQLSRYSRAALVYLDTCFTDGENGQDEIIIFSLINRANLTSSCSFLQSLIDGTWTWFAGHSQRNRILYEKSEQDNQLHIYHPIK